ncbi:hypothetical protein M430DRAFT_37112 [Amorphotheca resinae ATCC 22711]|uniref:Uncharacterized protein n=1 Tax=Amorphotheca resinae ATCC 22711 TaxID=857342 RepID=A0A2T3ARH0_AMORE|nr:hypothetical protein M430DRAFT_37112 [Amorphotheca resinae ATCC 22711]PSS08968.1 hypothetical protein M430DRAFT_37112 [Amorphotheca resinae ATCC 22711]
MTSPTPNLPNESHLLEDYNFVVLGLPGVGKSTFVTQFTTTHHPAQTSPPPSTLPHQQIQLSVDNQPCQISLSEAGPSSSSVALRKEYISASQAAILMYSITSKESFEKIREIWGEVREVKEEMGMWEPFQMGLVGNKMDLEGERVVGVHEGMGVAETLGCAFWEAEAETGRNTKELVEELVRKVRTYRDNERIRYEQMKEEAEKAKKEKVKNDRRKKMMPWKRLFS